MNSFRDNTRACQSLVNAQMSVNRAMRAMNKQSDPDWDAIKHGANISDQYIVREIENAICDLSESLKNQEEAMEKNTTKLLPGQDYLLIDNRLELYSPDKLERASGGFHTLCADVGIIPGHPLSGYVAGDVLPMSVWNQHHRPDCIGRTGFVYDPVSDIWVQIYLANINRSILNLSYEDFISYGQERGWRLLTSDEFSNAAEGSNEMTNIINSSRPKQTGGNIDQLARRMISNIGCEDCCGVMWQCLSTPDPVQQDWFLIAGANWNVAAYSGSRSRSAHSVRTSTSSSLSARFGSEPLNKRVATAR